MRRRLSLLVLAAALVGLAAVARQALSGREDQPARPARALAAAPGPLPVRQVVLFNSGVGYFQREGQVTGDGRVDLSFATGDINDLLKSLVLEDQGGGHVNVVSYDSHDPVDKILHSFALDLNSNPTFGQILNQARGEKIEVTLKPARNMHPATVKGTIVGMETRKPAPSADMPAGAVLGLGAEVDVLNLLNPDGMQSVLLDQIQSVRFLNPTLDSEFRRALDVLARSHDVQKKSVTLGFHGQGPRPVRVGYVVEQPIWKMTYRLRLEPGGRAFLQGWALVDNTTDEDWKGVRMVLVSGRPISFKMNLHEPLYVPRPTVEPDLFASLRPPLYSGAIPAPDQKEEKGGGGGGGGQIMPPQVGGFNIGGGGFNFGGGGFNFGGGFQGAGIMGQAAGPNRYQGQGLGGAQLGQAQAKLSYEELQKRRQELREAKGKAAKVGRAVTGLNFREGIEAVTAAEEIGDYFQYQVKDRVSLSRQRSAMIPVLAGAVEAAKLSIFNESVHSKHPLLGLRLKNTSGQPLPQGPVTVYEEQNYAGDTRMLHVQPAEERLLSYALDLGTEVVTSTRQRPGPEMAFRISGEGLTARYTLRQTKTYTVTNRSRQERTVLVEHPIRPEWKLVEPAKPAERGRDVYRFEVKASPGKSVRLVVAEDQPRVDPIALVRPKEGAPFYAVAEGVAVKPVTEERPRELVGLTITKGVLHARYRLRESWTYYVQNLSEAERSFLVYHLVPAGWHVAAGGKDVAGPGVYSFKVEVPAKKTVGKEVVQEKEEVDTNHTVRQVPSKVVERFLASPAVGKEVKAALEKTSALYDKLQAAERALGDARGHLKAVSEDQARLRENLKVLAQNSEPYKKLVERFVADETEIDRLQRRITELDAALQKQRREYDDYVTTLSAG